MNLIVETDIGHDPDDFFAFCYLIAAGVNIRAITIVPGDPDQIAITKLLLKEVGLDIPVGVSHENRNELSCGGVHHELLKKYRIPFRASHDGEGCDIIDYVIKQYPDCELFVIGPCTNVGKYLNMGSLPIIKATMQGGFLGYDLHNYADVVLDKFIGKLSQPTFNLNGDRKSAEIFLAANIKRRFVGKNVCHTVLYNKTVHSRPLRINSRAAELFKEGMDMYLAKHGEKKFHDPTAACCMLHPEIGDWVSGKVTKMDDGWGTECSPDGDLVLANIDYDQLWDNIINFK